MTTVREDLSHGSTRHEADTEFPAGTPVAEIVDSMLTGSPYKYDPSPELRAKYAEEFETRGWFGHGWSWFIDTARLADWRASLR